LAENAVLVLREPAVTDLVFRFAQTMRGIVFDDAGLDGVCEDAAKQPDSPGRGPGATPYDRFATQLSGLDRGARLPRHDVLENLVDVGLREILDPSRADEWDDVSVDATRVGANGRGFLRTSTLPEDKAGSEVGDVQRAQFPHRDRLVVE